MITGISIENFKGIREQVKLDLRPITLLFGANSAGKSCQEAPKPSHRKALQNQPL